jgi:hypothetical protein
LDPVEVQVALRSELRGAIGRDRVLGMTFASWELSLLTVDGTASRGEDDLTDPVPDAVLQQPNGAQYIHVGVEVRLTHGAAHVYLRGLVRKSFGFELLEDTWATGSNVCLVEPDAIGKVFVLAAREVVDDGHFVAPPHQVIGYM